MKRLFAILLVAILATSFAMANGPSVHDHGYVNCTVIAPLSITWNQNAELGYVSVGETKTTFESGTELDLVFDVAGETGLTYEVEALHRETAANGITIDWGTSDAAKTGLIVGTDLQLTYTVVGVTVDLGTPVPTAPVSIEYTCTGCYTY